MGGWRGPNDPQTPWVNLLLQIATKEIKLSISQIRILNAGISEIDLPHLSMIPFTFTSEAKFFLCSNTKYYTTDFQPVQ